jgi:hypothetical protein
MQGSCLSCSFKSTNYKSDMQKRYSMLNSDQNPERSVATEVK